MSDENGFGIDHLPYGVFGAERRVGVRFGDAVLDLGAIDTGLDPATWRGSLNGFLALGRETWSAVRAAARDAIERGAELIPLSEVDLHRPVAPPDYVDFYSSIEHATNVGRIFRPDGEPLAPNWRWLPVGYHGRAGTVVVSGTPVVRPSGQSRPRTAGEAPTVGPSTQLDIEVEVGFVVGTPTARGTAVPTDAFRD